MKNLRLTIALLISLILMSSCTQEIIVEELQEDNHIEKAEISSLGNKPTVDYSSNEIVIRYKKENITEVEKKIIRDSIADLYSFNIKTITRSNYHTDLNIELWELAFDGDTTNGSQDGYIEDVVSGLSSKEDDEADIEGDYQFLIQMQDLEGINGDFIRNLTVPSETAETLNGANVAIIDTGIHYGISNQPFLYDTSNLNGSDQEISGWDFVDGDEIPFDEHGHGTMVSAIILQNLDTQNVPYQILPVRAFDETGKGTYFDIVSAMAYIASIDDEFIVNASFGFYGLGKYNVFKGLIEDNSDKLLLVCSAGNYGVDTEVYSHYPSGFNSSNLIAVGGYEEVNPKPPTSGSRIIDGYAREDYSNYGKIKIDALAQYSHDISLQFQDGMTYNANVEGTSFSSAITTARVAFLWYKNSGFGTSLGLKESVLETTYISSNSNVVSEVVDGKILVTDYMHLP